MEYLKIDKYKDTNTGSVPYGILKKMELGRALISDPKLVILDEPAAGLNEQETRDLAETIRDLVDKFHCSVLLVEHDMRLVMSICNRICAISFGEFLACGSPEEIQNNKSVQEAYLGLA